MGFVDGSQTLVAWLSEQVSRIANVDSQVAVACQRVLDEKTKPQGSLGRLERVACQLAAIQGKMPSAETAAIVVFGADHGVAQEGVSAFPQVVTGQMLLNFARGGAAINVLAQCAQAELIVYDLGLATPIDLPANVRRHPLGLGTANLRVMPAMTFGQTLAALQVGLELVHELADRGIDILALGDMGIANTTPTAALIAHFIEAPIEAVIGRGTGVDDAGLARKRAVLHEALARHRALADTSAVAALASLGGFEIAALAGVVIGAAQRQIPVVIDGVITGAAALAAVHLAPDVRYVLMASHVSVEPAHRLVLRALDLEALFDFDMRLGEGSGAALALPILRSSTRIVRDMATFAGANVSDKQV